MRKKVDYSNTQNKFFLGCCCIILCIGLFSLVRTGKTESAVENRSLTQFPHLSIRSFFNLSYQKQFESALSDQFIFGETVKQKMNKFTKIVDYKNINKNICQNRYIAVPGSYGIFNCSDGMIAIHTYYNENTNTMIKERIKKLNDEISKYAEPFYYYISHANNFNFETNKPIYDFSSYFDNNYDELKFKNYNEFYKYFYKTDHHWNYVGSYTGYKDIIKMMTDDEVLEPVEEVDFNIEFRGSRSRISKITEFSDDFKTYKFNFDDHDEYIDGQLSQYGEYDDYYKGKITQSFFKNYYASFYGGDEGEIIYDFHDEAKDNLLIIGTSYTNAVNTLIASHFNKTFVIDLRYYEKAMKEKFSYEKYISNNNIDKVLIIGDYFDYKDGDLGIDLEEN